MTTVLEVHGLCKRFHQGKRVSHAVEGVSFRVHSGSVMALVGESGSGKTTVARCIVGLHDIDEGSLWLAGKPLALRARDRDFKADGERMQMVFQDNASALNPRFTAEELVAEGLLLRDGGSLQAHRDMVRRWFDKVGLPSRLLQRYPHELSGGQRQRLGIARALILEPRLLICDEPVSALDVSIQAQILMLLKSLREETGIAMLFISHDLSVVRCIADEVAVMCGGRIVEQGSAREVLHKPTHHYTQTLLAAIPEVGPASRGIFAPSGSR